MNKQTRRISVFMTILLVLQMVMPLLKPLAEEIIPQPQNVKAVEYSPANVRITWDAISGVNAYRVYELNSDQWEMIDERVTTSAYIRNVPEGSYTYAVTAVKGTSESTIIDSVSVNITYPELQSPDELTVKVLNGNDLRLSWSSAPNASEYNIYLVTDGVRERVKTLDSSYTSYTVRKLSEGKYNFEVTSAHPLFGESITPSQLTYELIHPEMQPPGDLIFKVLNGNDLRLSWNESEYASEYNVYQKIDGKRVLERTMDGTSYTFRNLPEGNYEYEVTSNSDRFGESAEASNLSYTLKHPTMQAPENLSLKVLNGNDLRLTWEESEFAAGYNIYQIIDNQKILVKPIEGSSTGYTFRNMVEGLYEFEVTSYSDRFGESESVSDLTYQLMHPVMAPPENLTVRILNGNDIRLTWNGSEFATGYNIYQVISGEKELIQTTDGTSYTFKNLPEGSYDYEVQSLSDRFGESPISSNISHQLVHPIMQAPTQVKNTVRNGNDINVSWAASEFATGYYIYQVIGDQRTLVDTVIGSTSLTLRNMPEGEYSYEVSSYSDRFGESVELGQTSLTLVFPEVEIPVLKLKSLVGQTATLTWNVINGITSFNVYEMKDGNAEFIGKTDKTSLAIFNIDDGTHSYVVTANHDRFGESNYSNVVQVEIQLDKIPPVTTSNIPSEWVKSNFSLQLTAEDEKSGVNKTYYSVNNASFAEGSSASISQEGTHQVSFYSTDKAGNVEQVKTETVKVDKTAPVTSADLESGTYKEAKVLNLSAVDNFSGVKTTYYSINGSEFTESTTIELAQGDRKVSFYSVDIAGNEEEVQTIVFTIDEAPPVTVSDIEEKWNQESVAVKLSATDNLSGVSQTFYSINGLEFVEGTEFSISGDGLHNVAYYSVDNAGNEEEVKTETVKIDSQAPLTTSNIEEGWVSGGFKVSLKAIDELSGVSKTYYSINGEEFTEGTSVVFPDDGNYEVSYYSIDIAGNEEGIKTEKVNVDNQAPVTVSNLEEKWYKDRVEVELSATDNLSGVEATYYSVNGSGFIEGNSLMIKEKGKYEISYYSVDNAGNVEEVKTELVKMDNQAPVTTSNFDDEWYQSEMKVVLTATDDLSGVKATYYSLDGENFTEGTEISLEADGIYEVFYYSVDKAGNIEQTQTDTVKIDSEAPVTSDNVSDIWYNTSFEVVLNADDNLSKVDKTYYSINGSEFIEGASFEVSEEGIIEVEYYSIDKAGNKEEVNKTQVKIDKTAPTISVDVQEEYKLGSEFAISYTAADGHSGIASEEVTINGVAYKNGDKLTLDQPGVYKLNITVTDHAGWITTVKKELVVYIPATLEVLPKVIKGNKGIFTVKANLPREFAGSSFDVPTATLNGVAPKVDNNGLFKQADKGHFKFEREDFDWKPGKVELEFRAYLDNGYLVIGSTLVDVK
ncbi:Ig-like domain repeat protein [Mesobacillus sp. LC4]